MLLFKTLVEIDLSKALEFSTNSSQSPLTNFEWIVRLTHDFLPLICEVQSNILVFAPSLLITS